MPIEFLREETIDEMIELFRKGSEDSAWADYVFDADILRINLENMIGKDSKFACMYRKEGKIVGGFVASIGTLLFSAKPVGMENGIYVEPEHRGGRVALLLYNEFIKWCEKMKAEPLVEIYFSDESGNQKTYAFFRKVGMRECGRIFRGGKDGLRP